MNQETSTITKLEAELAKLHEDINESKESDDKAIKKLAKEKDNAIANKDKECKQLEQKIADLQRQLSEETESKKSVSS